MKIVVAMDSFKGSLTAEQACHAVHRGLFGHMGDAEIVLKPMADGGEGTARALMTALGGSWQKVNVSGPMIGQHVQAGYAWIDSTQEAVVEMAEASGLLLVPADQLNPMLATTYGTGELIQAAVNKGAAHILLGVGGSATVDGGVGAAMALGWRFIDAAGDSIGLGTEGLGRLETIIPPDQPFSTRMSVLCDVESPMCGPDGSAAVYGPQKGASVKMVKRLEEGLVRLAQVVSDHLDLSIANLPGGGAAGGLAAGAFAFFGAELVPGIKTVMKASGLAEDVKDADWVVTGEGQFDEQSIKGKVVDGVAECARQTGAKVAVLAGRIELDEKHLIKYGIHYAKAISPGGLPLAEAMEHAERYLEEAAQSMAAEIS